MNDRVAVIIPSHPKYLSVVRALTKQICDISGVPEAETEDLKLAVDEACSNVIKHVYKGDAKKKIVVKYRVTKKTFEVIIEDSGVKSDAEEMKGRSLEDVRPGGLGIHFIKKVFDIFALDEKKKKGNRLKLVKYLKGKQNEN